MMNTNELMTRNEVAAYSGIGIPTLGNLVSQGVVTPAVRKGNGGKLKGNAYNQNLFTRQQAELLKRYVEAMREFKLARKALR